MTNVSEFFDKQSGEWADRYESDPRFARRLERISRFLDLVLPATSGGQALDMGCGSGVFSRLLAERGWRVTGVDQSSEMIEAAREASSESIEFKVTSIEGVADENLNEASFDLIVSFSMLEYIENDDAALDLFGMLLKEGGVLVLSVPNRVGVLRKIEGMIFGIRKLSGNYLFGNRGEYLKYQKHQYTPLELDLMLRQSGFRKTKGIFLNSGVAGPDWLVKFLERKWWASMYCAAYRKA